MALRIKKYLIFSLMGATVMWASMLAGEWLHGPLFNNFLYKPHLWLFWVLPLTWLNFVIIKWLPITDNRFIAAATLVFWLGLSVLVFILYGLVTDSRPPSWSDELQYVFGWYIPGVIIMLIFSLLAPIVFQRRSKSS